MVTDGTTTTLHISSHLGKKNDLPDEEASTFSAYIQ